MSVDQPAAAPASLREVGHRRPQADAALRVSGRVVYTPDVRLPGMLHAAILRSPHAHARLLRVNADRARALPGVRAVILAADFGGRRYLHMGGKLADRHPLAVDKVRFFGEEVAAIAADTLAIAHDALRLIEVDYEPLPIVPTPDAALAADAPTVHDPADTLGRNVAIAYDCDYGDVDRAFASAAHVFEDTYEHGAVTPVCMETNGTVASWDPGTGAIEIWTGTQSPYFVRKELAHVLDLPVERVRMRPVEVGGGFGGKAKINEQEALCAMLSMRAARPVRLLLDRREEFVATKTDHAKRIRIRTAVDAEGRLLARASSILIDNGAYTALASTYVAASRQRTCNLYRVPVAHHDCQVVYTNKVPGGQYRGMGAPQVIWAIESQLDEIAATLGIDPLELRLRNVNRSGDVTPLGWRISTCGMAECLSEVARRIGWTQKRRDRRPNRGVGIAAMIHPSGGVIYAEGNFSQSLVSLEAPGEVVVHTQTADTGTWQNTTLAQLAAEALGIAVGHVRVAHMSTTDAPDDLGSTASRVAFVVGNATRRAAEALAARIVEALALHAGRSPADVRLVTDGAEVTAVDGTVEHVDLAEIVQRCGPLSAQARFDTPGERPDPKNGYGNYAATYVFGAQAVEVEIDPATGRVDIVKMVVAQDVGRALNPMAIEGQIYGGVLQGIGMALHEELVFEEGRPVNASLLDYRVPRIGAAPPIEIVLVETIDPQGPFGAKAAAEPTINATVAALANAIADATGCRFKRLPIRADHVLSALTARAERPIALKPWKRPFNAEVATVRALYPSVVFPLLRRFGTRMARLPRPDAKPRMVVPSGLDALFGALSEPGRRSRIVAGGTDVFVGLRQGIYDPDVLVDITGIAALRGIALRDGVLSIGGATPLADVEADPLVERHLPVLRACLANLATPLVRAAATVAGDLCQEKRCWFFRSRFPCYQLGGTSCPCFAVQGDSRHHAVLGARRCAAPNSADLAPMLTALDAGVVVGSAAGERRIGMASLYRWSGLTVLAPGEAILRVEIPVAGDVRAVWEKFAVRQGDFAEASIAVRLRREGGAVRDLRIVAGAVSPLPLRRPAVEAWLLDGPIGPARIRAAAERLVEGALPLTSNTHKVPLLVNLAERALLRAFD